jgi:hypothetical protein
MLFLPLQTIGVIHSITDVSNEFLNFFLVGGPHVTDGPVTSGRGEILVAFGNGEIFGSGARRQE